VDLDEPLESPRVYLRNLDTKEFWTPQSSMEVPLQFFPVRKEDKILYEIKFGGSYSRDKLIQYNSV